MKQYFAVYKMILKLNFSRLLIYRAHFVTSLISGVGYGFVSFFLIIVLTARSPVVYGWKREELMLLMGVYNILIGGFFHMIFSRNFEKFSETIDYGRFDSYLIKPISVRFLISCSTISYTNLIRVFMGLAVVSIMMISLRLAINIQQLILFLLLSVFSLLLLYSIWFMVITLTIWNTRLGNLVNLLYQANEFTRYPPKMFYAKNYLLFIIPYTFIVVVPTKIILQKITLSDAFWLIFFALIFFYVSKRFWSFALRYYTSASS